MFVSLSISRFVTKLLKILNRFSYSARSINRQYCALIEVMLFIVTDYNESPVLSYF